MIHVKTLHMTSKPLERIEKELKGQGQNGKIPKN